MGTPWAPVYGSAANTVPGAGRTGHMMATLPHGCCPLQAEVLFGKLGTHSVVAGAVLQVRAPLEGSRLPDPCRARP